MNFISWATKPTIINENTQNYVSGDLVEESIAKTLKPVMNKMKKLNIGLPYRDARLFFFKFLQDNYPEVVPAGFETRKPSAKDVNAIVGQIATEKPELLDTIGAGFEQYSAEKTDTGLDRVSQFLNTAATLRQGKGVRPKKAEGYVRKDYSKLTAQEIADATTDAIAKKQDEFDAGDDVSDEKLLLRTAVGSVIAQLEKEDVSQEALDNVADAVAKIDNLSQFEKFLDYIADFEEYNVIRQYLVDTMDVIETNLDDMQAQKEDEEYEKGNVHDEVRQDPREVGNYPEHEDAEDCPYSEEDTDVAARAMKGIKAKERLNFIDNIMSTYEGKSLDFYKKALNKSPHFKDGKLTPYELFTIEREMKRHEDAENCPYSDEEIDTEKADLDDDGEISEYEKSRGEAIAKAMKKEQERAGQSHARAVADHYEDEEANLDNTPLEELSILSPEEFEMVQNFENFNPDEWGYNTLQKFYFRKREGGEDEEFSTSQYMSTAPVEAREEAEEVKMSQLEINQHLAVQERQRVQNLYAQQRRHTHGY